MAQVPGLGLDQSQLADVINQQYKGYSQKQRNQMMQSAATTPDNWGAITQQANKTATQPTEYLGAGRTSDIPNVSYNGERYTPISPDQYQQFESKMPEFGKGEFSPNYTNAQASYYNSTGLGKLNQLSNVYDYLGKINPQRTKTETWTPSAEQLASRKRWDTSPLRPDPSLGYRELSTGDEFGRAGQSIWIRQVQDTPLTYTDFMKEYGATPLTYTDFMKQYGATPESSRIGIKTLGRSLSSIYNKNKNPLQQWMTDPSFLPKFSLIGSGSPEDMQRGFNILQHMSPQNIGEFWSLSPDVQRGMLANPAAALQQMRATANKANGDWLSVGAEGGFSGFDAYNWDANRGLTVDPSRYLQIDDSNSGLLGSFNDFMNVVDPLNGAIENAVGKALGFDSGLDMVRGIGEPVGNLAGAIFSGGIPWGSIVMAADNISTGNDEALLGNVINGVGSYAGANVDSTGVMGTSTSLGSAAANSAANNMILNAGANYARTGDLETALKAAAFSTAAGSAGNWLGNTTSSSLGDIGSKALGGAASGGLNSLFSKQSPVAGSLFGAMSGGLHGFLNSTDRSNNTYNREQDTKNRNTAQTATKLAKLFTKK